MRTYVIQLSKPTGTRTEIMQANDVTEALNFIKTKYNNMIGHIEYIYSEEYKEAQ